MENCTLSECELLVMKVIWRSKETLSLQGIVAGVNGTYKRGWKQQTVSVFLGRIVRKNLLTSERRGRQFFYYPTMTEEEYCQAEAVRCVDMLSDGNADVFFAALAKARTLKAEEKERIRGLLDEMETR